MDFQTSVILPSLRVLVVNPLTPAGQMVIIKMLSGAVFGEDQLIDLILLVYSNEKSLAEKLRIELIACAYCCYNSVAVSSDLPSVADADVFCFMSNFYNLNKIELDKVDNDEQFDALYLIIKIANNFTRPVSIKEEPIDDGVKFVKKKKPKPKPRKPIFMADGLAAMDVLASLAKNMPHDIFFCLYFDNDADVFCFMSNFYNLNKIELDKVDNDEQFDALYLIIKIANNFTRPVSIKEEPIDDGVKFVKKKKPKPKPRKPIFMADGLAAMDVLASLAKNMPHDIFFCPTPLPHIAKSVLGDYLKVQCNEINDVLVWAANDEVFHVEVEKPMIIHDRVNNESQCDWDSVGKDLFRSFDYDHTQFSPSWMKKEFIEKVALTASKNPYGCIFRANLFAKSLKLVWMSRKLDPGKKLYCCMGVISDGSLGTIKGYPYVFPLIFCGESWSVNKRYEETPHLRGELKRINKAVKEHHQILIPYCKKFLQENVINQSFLPVPPESTSSEYSSVGMSSKTSLTQ